MSFELKKVAEIGKKERVGLFFYGTEPVYPGEGFVVPVRVP